MKIAFRVDSSQKIGTGHLMRCLNLAKQLDRMGHTVLFFCRAHPDSRLKPLVDSGLKSHLLPAPAEPYVPENPYPPHLAWLGVPLKMEIAQMRSLLEKVGRLDWMIVDHYALEAQWQQAMRPYAERIGAIDELCDRDQAVEWLLDSTLQRPSSLWHDRVAKASTLLVGSRYALLDSAYAPLHPAARRRAKPSGIDRIVISLGGAADGALYGLLLQAVRKSRLKHAAIDLVASAQTPGFEALSQLARSLEATLVSDLPSLADVLSRADLAIGAAGVSAYERACVGLPTLMVELAENQRANCEAFAQAGAAIALGQAKALTLDRVVQALDKLDEAACAQMRQAALRVCDGRGVKRAVLTLLPSAATRFGQSVRLRLIEAADEALIYGWQSTPGIRRFCRHPQVPTVQEHRRWMEARLIESGAMTLVVVCEGEAAGLLRLSRLEAGCEISLLIAPHAQKKGIASVAITLARTLVPTATLCAQIDPANTVSTGLFEKLGFEPKEEGWWHQCG